MQLAAKRNDKGAFDGTGGLVEWAVQSVVGGIGGVVQMDTV